MKKLLYSAILISLFFFSLITPLNAQEDQVNLYFFSSESCPHCANQEEFMEDLPQQYPYLEIHSFEISNNPQNARLFSQIGQAFNIDTSGVPLTIINNQYITGFNENTTPQKLISIIQQTAQQGDENPVGDFLSQSQLKPQSPTPTPTQSPPKDSQNQPEKLLQNQSLPEEISLPLIGTVKLESLSLPVLTFTVALLDGFNPCAMWVLLFLISLLLGMKNRARQWILGLSFILASGIVYFLFLSAWLNFFLFVGFISWVRLAIGVLAIGAGIYYLKDYLSSPQGGCETTSEKQRNMIFDKLKKSVHQHNLLLAILGITVIAFAVNLIELVCSAGLPAIYTHILSLNQLPPLQYYLYLVFYVVIFMIDDLIIFTIAMSTLHTIGIQNKYARFSRLIGGILILLLGLALIFKPGLLTFS